ASGVGAFDAPAYRGTHVDGYRSGRPSRADTHRVHVRDADPASPQRPVCRVCLCPGCTFRAAAIRTEALFAILHAFEFMTLKELKELIDLFTSRESIEELEIEKAGVRLKVKRQSGSAVHEAPVVAPVQARPVAAPVQEAPATAPAPVPNADSFPVKAPV